MKEGKIPQKTNEQSNVVFKIIKTRSIAILFCINYYRLIDGFGFFFIIFFCIELMMGIVYISVLR